MIVDISGAEEGGRLPTDGPGSRERVSHILHDRARRYHWEGEGLLSLKAFFGGSARYRAGGGCYAVREGSYLLLNQGRSYAVAIESATPVESLCVFFAPGLVADVHRNLTAPPERLLDDPGARQAPPEFVERTYRQDAIVAATLHRLRAALARGERDQGWLSEQVHDLLAQLLRARDGVQREVDALPLARAVTRDELYRRVHRARDYADALLDRPLTLAELAGVACLSPNHLLRAFRLVLGQTPGQYLAGQRLERARRLLLETDRPVTEICLAIGFQSLGTFSRRFRHRFGVSPDTYRRRFG